MTAMGRAIRGDVGRRFIAGRLCLLDPQGRVFGKVHILDGIVALSLLSFLPALFYGYQVVTGLWKPEILRAVSVFPEPAPPPPLSTPVLKAVEVRSLPPGEALVRVSCVLMGLTQKEFDHLKSVREQAGPVSQGPRVVSIAHGGPVAPRRRREGQVANPNAQIPNFSAVPRLCLGGAVDLEGNRWMIVELELPARVVRDEPKDRVFYHAKPLTTGTQLRLTLHSIESTGVLVSEPVRVGPPGSG